MGFIERLRDNVSPIIQQNERFQKIIGAETMKKIPISASMMNLPKKIMINRPLRFLQENSSVMDSLVENNRVIQEVIGAGSVIERFPYSNITNTVGGIKTKSIFSSYEFEQSTFKAIETCSNSDFSNFVKNVATLITNPVIQEIQSTVSSIGKYLLIMVDFSPLASILETITNTASVCDYEEVKEVILKAMFESRWFPGVGWIANYKITNEFLEILNTSKASKNRVKRIDTLIFSYYKKNEIDNFKRKWRMMNLPSYMIRILVQSVQAYHRREYALTVCALSTFWEGIIQEKMNDTSFRISNKTRDNLTKLIEENQCNDIISSFCEEFIFYNCQKPEDVKPDVPGRHSIAHSWYQIYPSRKMALNAILFTDFLLGLKPIK